MKLRRINFDHGSGCGCGDCTGGGALDYFNGLAQVPNIEQIVPVPGPSGKNNSLVGGVTNSSGVLSADGTDEAINSTAKSNLTSAGFNIESKPTSANVTDTSDTGSNKIWTGISRALINFIGLYIVPARVPVGGTADQILKKVDGTDWNTTWTTPTNEKYNTTTTTSFAYNIGSIGTSQAFTVSAGMSYKFKHVLAIVDPSNPANYLEGIVVSYSGTTLTLQIKNISGSGTTLNWNVMLTAPEYMPFLGDPANQGKFFYNNAGVITMRASVESVGNTKLWFSQVAPDDTYWLCDGTEKTIDESPGLYLVLVTNNGGVASPFYVSSTSFTLPNVSGAALVGVKSGGSDAVSLGGIVGQNILTGGIQPKNMPVTSPYQLNDPGHSHTSVVSEGILAADGAARSPVLGGVTGTSTTGITTKLNNIAGGQAENGGQDLDIRQKSIGVYLYIKAL